MSCKYTGLQKYLILPVLLFVACSAYSQEIKVDTIKVNKVRTIRILTIRTVPKFILQMNVNFNSGALELSAHNGGFSRDDFIRGKNFGARNGLGVSLTGKLPLHKKGYFWLTATGNYNRFQSNLIAANNREGQVAYNVFGGGLGADFMITPASKVKYYFGATTLFSVISGSATLISIDTTNTSPTKTSLDINAAFRIGYALNIGLEYAPAKNFGINLGLRFSHLNLFLKKNTLQTDTTKTDLNDNTAEVPSIYAGWKQFAFTSVYLGVSYYFGVREKRYKLP